MFDTKRQEILQNEIFDGMNNSKQSKSYLYKIKVRA